MKAALKSGSCSRLGHRLTHNQPFDQVLFNSLASVLGIFERKPALFTKELGRKIKRSLSSHRPLENSPKK